jgi:3-phosphoglycerate kinase
LISKFYKAHRLFVGFSLVENDKLELAASLLAKGVSTMLLTDVVIADKFDADISAQVSYVLKNS